MLKGGQNQISKKLLETECPYCCVNIRVYQEELTITCPECWLNFNTKDKKEIEKMEVCADGLTEEGLIPEPEELAKLLSNVIDKIIFEANLIAANTPGKIALRKNLLGFAEELKKITELVR